MALGKMQLIAIGVVAILAIAAISFVIINNNNDDEGTPLDVGVAEFRLDVYGNANEDLKIDEADKQIIQDIIDGKKDIADYPLANANMDKVNKKANVDAEDLALVDKMIAGEPCTVYIICLDASGGEVELPIEFPVINAVCWGSNMLTPFINSGAVDHCAGYMAKKSSSYPVINDVLFSSDATNIEVSRQMDSNKWQDFMDLDSECTSAGKGIDAFFVDHSVTSLNDNPNYRVDLRDSGIPEIRLAVADPIGDINAALLMGFLTCETAGYDYAVASIDAYREVVDIIEAITNPVEKTYMCVTMSTYICQNNSTFNSLPAYVGGVPYYTTDSTFKYRYEGTSSVQMMSSEALSNYDDVNYIFCSNNIDIVDGGLSDQSIITEWEDGADLYKTLDCYEGRILVNAMLPGAVKLAYIASVLYPEQFSIDVLEDILSPVIEKSIAINGYELEDLCVLITYQDYESATAA